MNWRFPSGRETIVVVNTLPSALRHYETVLAEAFEEQGFGVRIVQPDFELGGLSRLLKFVAACRGVSTLARVAPVRSTVIVVWPAFGLADLALWWLPFWAGRRIVLIHDPQPLRRQVGYSRLAKLVARRASRSARIEVTAHTELAADELRRMGVVVSRILPHPIAPPVSRAASSAAVSMSVLVAGQFKAARDDGLLLRFGRAAPSNWDLKVVGRGWPDLKGWTVDSRFLSEAELTAEVSGASAVMLPYEYYFQSGIAVRAFEQGVPVVAARHEFIEALYGSDWPGLVDGPDAESWVAAAMRAANTRVATDSAARQTFLDAWAAALTTPHLVKEG